MLEAFSSPQSIAVIGASRTPGKLGHSVLTNLIRYGYRGAIYPVNPYAKEIEGLPCYPSVLDIPGPVDLAVIVVPAPAVPDVIEACGQKGVQGVVIITAGFREVGPEGMRWEQQMLQSARKHGLRILGPNVLGVIDTLSSMNASFAAAMPPRGDIALMSQSGALGTAILDIAISREIGFSHFVSLGNKLDLNESDFIEAWADDPHTRVIIAYLEGVVEGPRFMQLARRVTQHKPIIALKSGRTTAGARAVSSHTGTLAGSDKAYETAFRQTGILRANSVQELFDYAIAFAWQPMLRSDRIAIITNAGGPGIMATDACEQVGLQLASLSKETIDYLREHLPKAANVLNPVDVLGDALADRYALALEAVLNDPTVGGVVVVLTPQAMTQIEETARVVGDMARRYDKPIVASFMGEANVRAGVRLLNRYKVPNYPVPERAVAALGAMRRYRLWQTRAIDTPPTYEIDRDTIRQLFDQVWSEGRLQIGDAEARTVLQACGIPIPQAELAETAEEAVEIAERIGYPVALKIASPDILHKSDFGGVKLNLHTSSEVHDAFDLLLYRASRYFPGAQVWGCQVQEMVRPGYEIIIGVHRDPQFGPLVMFGLGGIYVEVLKDVTFRIAPFGRQDALEMINELHSSSLLRGVRGKPPADIEAIADTILRIAQLAVEFPEIVELDINPLIVHETGHGAIAVDMRLVLSERPEEKKGGGG